MKVYPSKAQRRLLTLLVAAPLAVILIRRLTYSVIHGGLGPMTVSGDRDRGRDRKTGSDVTGVFRAVISGRKEDPASSGVMDASGPDAGVNVKNAVGIVNNGGDVAVKPEGGTVVPGMQPLELCPEKPPINETKVALNLTEVTYDDLRRALGRVLEEGGHYAPSTCRSRERVALIIPYRDRERNLRVLLHNLVPFLARQQIEFTIFVVEQSRDYLFNRCLMFNVGYVLARKLGNFSCFILHDTDLVPRDYRNLYRCHSKLPRHMLLVRSNENTYKRLPYRTFIGGVLAMRKEHIEAANGCSNFYYGWGLEDDDLEIRLKTNGYPVVRYPMEIGEYYTMGHVHQTGNQAGGKLRQTIGQRRKIEGLNTLNYTLLQQQRLPLYTWFLVKPPSPPPSIYGDVVQGPQPASS